jgi:hypothetical protein
MPLAGALMPAAARAGIAGTAFGLGGGGRAREPAGMHAIEVVVVSPEEATHGVAEFWVGGELFGFTRLEEAELLLHVVPRPDGTTLVVGAHLLVAALQRAREQLAAT